MLLEEYEEEEEEEVGPNLLWLDVPMTKQLLKLSMMGKV
jgi:hypothetical protein